MPSEGKSTSWSKKSQTTGMALSRTGCEPLAGCDPPVLEDKPSPHPIFSANVAKMFTRDMIYDLGFYREVLLISVHRWHWED